MDLKILIRSGIIFLALMVSMGANVEDNVFARLGLGINFGLIVLAALLATLLVTSRHAFVVVVIVAFSLNANMPVDFGLNFGVDRDLYTGFMFALLMQPVAARALA